MNRSLESYITRTKLSALHQQRERLRHAYASLQAELETSPDPLTGLQGLYQGLKDLTFAEQPLHPEIPSLDRFFEMPDLLSEEWRTFWLGALQRERHFGQNRAEVAYLFGALLEEWLTASALETPSDSSAQRATLIAGVTQPREANPLHPLIAEMLEKFTPVIGKRKEQEEMEQYFFQGRIFQKDVERALNVIIRDIYRPADLRREAAALIQNTRWVKEMADALTIQFNALHEWSWDEAGIEVEATLTRNKWRLFLREDLPTAVFLTVIGIRWRDNLFQRRDSLMSLFQFEALSAPAVIKGAHLKVLGELNARTLRSFNRLDLAELELTEVADFHTLRQRMEYHSVIYHRADQRAAIQTTLGLDSPYAEGESSGMAQLVRFVHAEVQLARAAFPERPVYVVKLDLADFYPSISHALIVALVEKAWLSERAVPFITRYLNLSIREGEAVLPVQVGIPNDHLLSHVLAEDVLSLMDAYIEREAAVRVVRVVDDITLIAYDEGEILKGWEAAGRFCEAAGWRINTAKCGSVCIGGATPAGLPAGLPGWMLLELHPDGHWRVNLARFESQLTETREAIQQADAVLSCVNVYNNSLTYLMEACCTSSMLGDVHRQAVYQVVVTFHTGLMGDGVGITAYLRALLRERFAAEAEMPEAWFYWALTAGGLGLKHPLILLAGLQEAYTQKMQSPAAQPPAHREKDWQIKNNNAWAQYYAAFFATLEVSRPASTQLMNTLVKDFIQRGLEISGQHQTDLSPYWRWILAQYGPQILDTFGSFRFLNTELVPTQVVIEGRIEDTSLA